MLVQLTEEYKDNVTDAPANQEEEDHDVTKREAKEDKQIETAVFVDNIMFNVIKDRNPGLEVIETIIDLVLTIMNGVGCCHELETLVPSIARLSG